MDDNSTGAVVIVLARSSMVGQGIKFEAEAGAGCRHKQTTYL
jgi:hypothetical protein